MRSINTKPDWEKRFDDVLAIVGLADNGASQATRVKHDAVLTHLYEATKAALEDARATSRKAALVTAIQHTVRTKDAVVVRMRLEAQLETDAYRRANP